jgi:predicted GIY-YIG superfamily endonuclease
LNDLGLSAPMRFSNVDWATVPEGPGVYVILDREEVIYVGMAGRNGSGGLRKRLKDHASGQIVNMFAQYLFLARAQFLRAERVTHPRDAKAACREYITERCAVRFRSATSGAEARALERQLKLHLKPSLNP